MLQLSRDKKYLSHLYFVVASFSKILYLPAYIKSGANYDNTLCTPALELMLLHKTMVRGCHML